MGGLFPPNAPATSDVAAVVEVALAVSLVLGALLARTGHIRAHRYLQSSVILVNIPIVLYAMVPPYLKYIVPGLPGHLGEPTSLIPSIMLVAGATAELLGIYIILVAGTTWIPERFRFRNYKRWMRTELGLWWAVVICGLLTYWLLFVPGAAL